MERAPIMSFYVITDIIMPHWHGYVKIFKCRIRESVLFVKYKHFQDILQTPNVKCI